MFQLNYFKPINLKCQVFSELCYGRLIYVLFVKIISDPAGDHIA